MKTYQASLLDSILDNAGSGGQTVTVNNDLGSINWVAGMSDPGEMIACGAYQQLRRHAGESDEIYAARLRYLLAELPADHRAKIETAGILAATKRASLDTTGGRVRLMTAGKLPWHGLGVNVSEAVNSADAIRLAGLDWQVIKQQLSYDWNGQQLPIPDLFANVRGDNGMALGTVGKIYKVIQNTEAFQFLDDVLSAHGARYEACGSLFGGSQVFMLAHLPEGRFSVNGKDSVEPYVLFTNSHDGKTAARCFPTAVRVVCANTKRLAMAEAKKGIVIRHTGNMAAKKDDARDCLGLALDSFQEFKAAAEAMSTVPAPIRNFASDVLDASLDITAAQAAMGADVLAAALTVTEIQRDLARKEIAKKIERRGEILTDILNRYELERNGTNGMRGSAWAAFNAVTDSVDHNTIGRQFRSEAGLSRKFENVLVGAGDAMKEVAYQKAMALTR